MKIVFLGNCQAASLRAMYDTFVGPYTDDVTEFLVATVPWTAESSRAVEEADLVVEQVFDMRPWAKLSDVSVRGKVHRVPVVGAPFLWPFAGSGHPSSREKYGEYDPFRSEIGDGYLNRLLAEGHSPDDAAELYLNADMAEVGRIDRLRELTMDRQRARDLATGYKCSEIIEDKFRDEQLFLTPYHLSVTMARYMAISLLTDIGAPSQCISLVQRRMVHGFYPPYATPVHPSIAEHFGLKWADETTTYPFHSEGSITFSQFVRKYVLCDANGELNDAIQAVARGDSDSDQKIEAVAKASPESPRLLVALGQSRLRRGLIHDAICALKRAIEIDPVVEWAHQILSQCLYQSGDLRAAEEALQQAITLGPHHHGLAAYLARLQASRGALSDAIQSIDWALDFAPKKSAYLAQKAAYRSQLGAAGA